MPPTSWLFCRGGAHTESQAGATAGRTGRSDGVGAWRMDAGQEGEKCGVVCVCLRWCCGCVVSLNKITVSYPYWWHHMRCHRREGCVTYAYVCLCESNCEITLSQWVGVRADCVIKLSHQSVVLSKEAPLIPNLWICMTVLDSICSCYLFSATLSCIYTKLTFRQQVKIYFYLKFLFNKKKYW